MNTQNLLFIDSEIDDLQSITQMVNHQTIALVVTYINDEYIIISGQESVNINKVGIISNNPDFINNYKNIYLSKISCDYTDFIDWTFEYSDCIGTIDSLIKTSLPNITKLGGVFEIINNPNINYNINQENGQITFSSDNVGIYDIHIQYTYNIIKFLCRIQVIVKPIINYNLNEFTLLYLDEFTSSTPSIKPNKIVNAGKFSSENSNVIVDKITGQLKISKLSLGEHLININYEYNDVKINIPINIFVKSILQYQYNTYYIDWNKQFNSDMPIILENNILDGHYELQSDLKISIEKKTGKIKSKGLDIGEYIIQPKYIGLNKQITTQIKLVVKPVIKYKFDNLIENDVIVINSPTIQSNNKNLKFSFANNSNIHIIDENNGQITLKNVEAQMLFLQINVQSLNYSPDGCLSGTPQRGYSFNYKYTIEIQPYINYQTNFTIDYQTNKQLVPKYYGSVGTIEITNFKEHIKLDNSSILIDSSFDIGKYKLGIVYTKNNIPLNLIVSFDVVPVVNYHIDTKHNISQTIIFSKPQVSHKNGIFKISNSNLLCNINEKTGQINIQNALVGFYNIDVEYQVERISHIVSLYFNICPTFYYSSYLTSYYTQKIKSIVPTIEPNNGSFSITENPDFGINTDGTIYNKKNIDVGTHEIKVKYSVNSQITETIYYLTIKPLIKYAKRYQFNYNQPFEIIPEKFEPLGGEFTIFENPQIIEQNGIISNKKTKITSGIWNIKGKYKFNNLIESISSDFDFVLEIKPVVIYDKKSYICNYSSNYIFEKPQIIEEGGLFKLTNNNSKIHIDQDGILVLDNNLEPGNYDFNINYTKNESSVIIPFSLIIKPTLYYDIIEHKYKTTSYSNPPVFSPFNGYFSCQYSNFYSIDNQTGIITFNKNLDLGKCDILVKYISNNSWVEFNYSLNVIPNINYTNNLLKNSKSNIFSTSIPQVNPPNGTFELLNYIDLFEIKTNGKIIAKSINTVGKFDLEINYIFSNKNSKTIININIVPTIEYENIILVYSENINNNIIKPKTDIIGNYKLANSFDLFNINPETGYISFTNIALVGKYNLQVIYEYNNVIVNTECNIIINPIFYYDKNNLVVKPLGGKFTINSKYCSIDENNGNIINNQNLSYGSYQITPKYTLNDITIEASTYINIELQLKYELVYDTGLSDFVKNKIAQNLDDIILFKGVGYNFEPIINNTNNLDIKYYMDTTIKGVNVNATTGTVIFNKNIEAVSQNRMTFKVYAKYENYQTFFIFKCIVLPPFNYNLSKVELNYGELITLTPSINNFENAEFYSTDISVNKITGIVEISNLDVGKYNFIIYLNLNFITIQTQIDVLINPIFKYNNNIINIKYGTLYNSEQPEFTKGGLFSVSKSNIKINETTGIITVSPTFDVGTDWFDVTYNLNNVICIYTWKIISNPILEYNNKELVVTQNNELYSEMPNFYPKNGTFSISNTPVGVSLKQNGIIHIDKNLLIGKYDIHVMYKINNISLTNNITIKVLPQISYKQNEHEIYDNIIKTTSAIVSNNDGFFDCSNLINGVSINRNNGMLTFKNLSVGTYSFLVNYNLFNVSNQYEYKVKILPSIKFTNKLIKKYSDIYTTDLPIVYPLDGNFYINNSDNISINNQTGQITLNNTINIGKQNIILYYNYNDYISSHTIEINTIPDIYIESQKIVYSEIISIPIQNYIPFICDNHVIENGNLILKNYNIGNYDISMNCLYTNDNNKNDNNKNDNLNFNINFNLDIYSLFYYDISNIELNYGEKYQTKKPIVSCYNDESMFLLNNCKYKSITIDFKTGELYIYDKLPVDIYNLTIEYKINNKSHFYDLTIKIKPIIKYIFDDNYLDSNDIFINTPIVQPYNGTFEINNNNFIVLANGELKNINKLKVNEYNILVSYKVNNITNDFNIKFNIQPNILFNSIYNIQQLPYEINNTNNFDFDNYSYEIENINNGINIDSKTGIIKLTDDLLPSSYFVNVKLNYLNTFANKVINIIYDPLNEITKTFLFSDTNEYIIDLNPNITFSLENNNNNYRIQSNKLILTNLDVSIYKFNLLYNLNNLKKKLTVNVKVIPHIKYNELYNICINEHFLISPTKNLHSNGTFKISNNNFKINQYGQISMIKQENINCGLQEISVEYLVNNQINKATFNIMINPYVNYLINSIDVNYGNDYYSNKPLFSPQNDQFKFSITINENEKADSNISINEKADSNISINENSGVIFIPAHLDIGVYNLVISYGTSNCNIILTIKPLLFYEKNNLELKYLEQLVIYPSVSKFGGTFSINNNSEHSITINPEHGIISIINPDINDYELTIAYEYGGIIVTTKINLSINIDLKYENNNIIFEYNSTPIRIIPDIKTIGGVFYAQNIDGFKLDNDGILHIINPEVGNYSYDIKYKYNNKKVTNIINILVNPIIKYESNYDFFEYDNININGTLCPLGGKISIDNSNLEISNHGNIINTQFLDISNHKIKVTYNYNSIITHTYFNINIKPIVYYSNITCEYGSYITHGPISNQNIDIKYELANENTLIKANENTLIKANENPVIKANENLVIDSNTGIISGFEKVSVQKSRVKLSYYYNNKKYYASFKVTIKPKISYDNYRLFTNPPNGNLIFDKQIIDITNNQIQVHDFNYGSNDIKLVYQVNNISKTLLINVNKKPIKLYSNTKYIFNYNDDILIKPIVDYGSFKLLDHNVFAINNGTISLYKKDNNIGIYNVTIIYENNNLIFEDNINIEIKPIIKYKNNIIQVISNQKYNSDLPELYPPNGKVSIKLLNNINSNSGTGFNINRNGVIEMNKIIPGDYKFEIKYEINNISTNYIMNVESIPYFNIPNNNINIKYGEVYSITNLNYHNKSIITSSNSYLNIINNQVCINNFNVGTYDIELIASLNNKSNTQKIKLIVEPICKYNITEYTKKYNEKLIIDSPFCSNFNEGTYSILVNSFSNSILVNDKNGQITIDMLELGEYKIQVIYKLNDYEIKNILTINVVGHFKYNSNIIKDWEKQYSYDSDLPEYYPLNGTFNLENNQNNNVIINKQTGLININNLPVGKYTYNVNYIINKKILRTKIDCFVNTLINYENPYITIKYDIKYNTDKPNVSVVGGLFECINLPESCFINSKTGIISINQNMQNIFSNGKIVSFYKPSNNKVPIGIYNLTIQYKLNQTISTTIITINII